MKTAKEYFRESYDNVSDDSTLTLPLKNLLIIMEEYAQYKVNELNKSDVIKSVCEHKSRWVGKAVIEYCKDCETALQVDKQTVL